MDDVHTGTHKGGSFVLDSILEILRSRHTCMHMNVKEYT